MVVNQVVTISSPRGCSEDISSAFWKLWQQYRDYLYRCCLQWMGRNPTDAEDALSRAMLKAWEKLREGADVINFKAWLTRLTHNLCIDIHRERKRGAQGVDIVEDIEFAEHEAVASKVESPETEILRREMEAYLHHAITSLPTRLREPFVLRYYQERSCRDIADQLALSEDNVWKRIQQARAVLQKQLNKYLSGQGDASPDLPLPPHSVLATSEKRGVTVKEPPGSEPLATSNWEVSMTVGTIVQEINYKVTATCLETLPHAWYRSPSALGWI